MAKKTINTYQSLGRLIIKRLYDTLWTHKGSIGYKQFKVELSEFLNSPESSCIDKSFAMHEYNHGKNPSDNSYHTYRWENIMDFYINQQYKADLLQRNIITNKDNDPDIAYHLPYGAKLPSKECPLFDEARVILRKKYEQRLNAIRKRNGR